ncbi:MAG: 2-oxoglutarate dehydrogenase complex dihydrolipoyllysine-residue succinyltransferase, partial [Gammaproteobacteria bacterium]|nr:2-oxoglutarate dehydrogenase complex dihydrolipoyllysine-residue succinyltransferase [Gammaproteobacteria bacterium]
MSIEVKVPELPESVADGVLLEWHKQVGEAVSRDENLVDIETDKVVLEIPAPETGVIQKVMKKNGDVVTSGEVLAVIDPEATAVVPYKITTSTGNAPVKATDATPTTSPAVRQLVADNNLDITQITGTGKGGRIIKQDVLDYMANSSKAPDAIKAETMAMSSIPVIDMGDERREERVPMTRLRARVAERLVQSQHTAAILTTFNEVNMQPVMDLRAKYRDRFERKHEVKLGFMSFFVRACAEALKQFPIVNASVDGNDIIYHGYYDIGIAVSSPRGLVVPILRDVESMSFAGIEKTIRDFGTRARDGKLGLDELSGGTFSITNGGIFGSMLSTPIINPPQSAILG